MDITAILEWDEKQVAKWLSEQGFNEITQTFLENDINGELLLDLNFEYLKELGIKDEEQRSQLLAKINILKLGPEEKSQPSYPFLEDPTENHNESHPEKQGSLVDSSIPIPIQKVETHERADSQTSLQSKEPDSQNNSEIQIAEIPSKPLPTELQIPNSSSPSQPLQLSPNKPKPERPPRPTKSLIKQKESEIHQQLSVLNDGGLESRSSSDSGSEPRSPPSAEKVAQTQPPQSPPSSEKAVQSQPPQSPPSAEKVAQTQPQTPPSIEKFVQHNNNNETATALLSASPLFPKTEAEAESTGENVKETKINIPEENAKMAENLKATVRLNFLNLPPPPSLPKQDVVSAELAKILSEETEKRKSVHPGAVLSDSDGSDIDEVVEIPETHLNEGRIGTNRPIQRMSAASVSAGISVSDEARVLQDIAPTASSMKAMAGVDKQPLIAAAVRNEKIMVEGKPFEIRKGELFLVIEMAAQWRVKPVERRCNDILLPSDLLKIDLNVFIRMQEQYGKKVYSPEGAAVVKHDKNQKAIISISAKDLKNAEISGYLMKITGNLLGKKMWKRKWFILHDYVLYYFDSPDDQTASGKIPLPGYTVSPTDDIGANSKKHTFKITHATLRTHFFAAASKEEMDRWIKFLGTSTYLENSGRS